MKILSPMLSQLPAPPAGAIETWLVCAAAVTSLVVLAMKLFVRKPPIEAEFVSKAALLNCGFVLMKFSGNPFSRRTAPFCPVGITGKLELMPPAWL